MLKKTCLGLLVVMHPFSAATEANASPNAAAPNAPVPHAQVPNAKAPNPEQTLFDRFRADHIYPRMECIALEQEETRAGWVYFAVREKHDSHCGGDPEIMPVADRYRIKLNGQRIEHYEAADDEYTSYSDFRKSRDRAE